MVIAANYPSTNSLSSVANNESGPIMGSVNRIILVYNYGAITHCKYDDLMVPTSFMKTPSRCRQVVRNDNNAFATFQSVRSPDGSICKRGLPVQFSVHFNHFQMTNS